MDDSNFQIEDYLPTLEDEIGEITRVKEYSPGVFNLTVGYGGPPWIEYFAVLDDSPIAAKVRNYGKKMDGLRLFDYADDTSGFRIVEYESSKYSITISKKPVPEHMFRDITLHAMEHHPEYFGTFPVPFHTPHGYTLLHRTLSNGIYWLETSECTELLAVCFPIWNAELSTAAMLHAEMTKQDRRAGADRSTCYSFFSKEASCVPIYELLETRKEWEGTVIDRPALMNAIWKHMPAYALYLNEGRMICMYPDTGTEFLLLR